MAASRRARRRQFRREATLAEQRLWQALRDRQLAGAKFRRQYPVGPYILDFYCPAQQLAIEADGESHATPEGQAHDAARTEVLTAHGIRVLRFTNQAILSALPAVLATIQAALLGKPSP